MFYYFTCNRSIDIDSTHFIMWISRYKVLESPRVHNSMDNQYRGPSPYFLCSPRKDHLTYLEKDIKNITIHGFEDSEKIWMNDYDIKDLEWLLPSGNVVSILCGWGMVASSPGGGRIYPAKAWVGAAVREASCNTPEINLCFSEKASAQLIK